MWYIVRVGQRAGDVPSTHLNTTEEDVTRHCVAKWRRQDSAGVSSSYVCPLLSDELSVGAAQRAIFWQVRVRWSIESGVVWVWSDLRQRFRSQHPIYLHLAGLSANTS